MPGSLLPLDQQLLEGFLAVLNDKDKMDFSLLGRCPFGRRKHLLILMLLAGFKRRASNEDKEALEEALALTGIPEGLLAFNGFPEGQAGG